MLKIDGKAVRLRHARRSDWCLEGLAFAASEGDLVTLEGESGTGKTTVLRYLLGDPNVSSTDGQVSYCTQDNCMSPLEVRKTKRFGYVGVDHPFFNWCSIERSIIQLAARTGGDVTSATLRSCDMLAKLNLNASLLARRPDEVSFGQRRRLALLAAAVRSPAFMFIDEIFQGLDRNNCRVVADYVADLLKTQKMIVAVTTHEARELSEIASRRYALEQTEVDGMTVSTMRRHFN